MDSNLVSYFNAVSLSQLMHKGQSRRDLDIPYWTHVSLVSSTVAEWGGDMTQILAALAHDLIEDTSANRAMIDAILGEEVGELVEAMTGSKDKNVSWTDRKLAYIRTFAEKAVPDRTYLDKLCDMHANMTSFSNTAIRSGAPSAKPHTIESYVALTHICLDRLEAVGTPEQFRVARYNMHRMLSRIIDVGVCPSATLLAKIGTDVDWFHELELLWKP